MKSRLAIAITFSGWFILASDILYEYLQYGTQLVEHVSHPPYAYQFFFHIMIVSAPFISTAMGYLVEERSQLLNNISESEKKYRDLYENAPDGYHSIGSDGTILSVNNTWLKMLGYKRTEVEGRMLFKDLLTHEGIETFIKQQPLFKEKGAIDNLEFDLRRKDGGLLPVVINATAVFDKKGDFLKSRTIVRDNSVKKGYEKILTRVLDEWRATFDSMPYGVMLLDSECSIVRTNRYISELSGVPKKELIGRKCFEVVHGQDKPINDCALMRSIETREPVSFEYYEASVGKYFLLSITPMFDEEGSIMAYVHSVVDISDLKGKEKKLEQSKQAFFNMLSDASAAYEDLEGLYQNLVVAFANAIDAKSPWTKGHSERVTFYATTIAKEMGLKSDEIEMLRTAALLHDIGKIGTYDGVLDKPGKLTDDEFAMVKMHPAKGEEILRPIKGLEKVFPIIRSHHERLDGRGYPDGLRGDEIPLMARILCVADSYDSMTADRPYRPSPGTEYAIAELKRCSCTQFDPEVVEAFLSVIAAEEAE